MKKLSLFLCTLVCLPILATGCGDKSGSSSAQSESSQMTATVEKPKHNVVKTTFGECDYVHLPDTLDELINEADFIAKIYVSDTSVSAAELFVTTTITPEFLEIYKGEYDGSPLNIYGGYMKLRNYMSTAYEGIEGVPDELTDTSRYTEEQLGEEIYDNITGTYIPDPGDTIIYFGEKSDYNNCYEVAGAYQGVFNCNGDMVENQGLEVSENQNGFNEPIANDIMEKFSGTEIIEQPLEYVDKEEMLTIPANDFETELRDNV